MRKFVLAIAMAAALSGAGLGTAAALPRGGCEEWACGSSNGTKLTGIVQETVAATGAVVIGVMLPSGETIDLR